MNLDGFPVSRVLPLFFVAPFVACSQESASVDASQTVAAIELAEGQSGLMPGALMPKAFPLPLAGTDATTTPEQAAQNVAAAIPESFEPAGCASASVNGASVTYTLDGCTPGHGVGSALHPNHGRGNRLGMSATFTLSFSASEGGLSASIVGEKVAGRGAELQIEGSATLGFDGTKRTLVVTTQGTGTGPNGQALTRKSSHTRSYDTATGCFSLDGVWSLDGPNGRRERSVSGYVQCGDSCPTSGILVGEGLPMRHGMGGSHGDHAGAKNGKGQHGGAGGPSDVSNARDVVVTVVFDGSDQASWSSDDGESGSLGLACTPAG